MCALGVDLLTVSSSQTTFMLQTFDAEHDTFTQLVACYLAARLFMAASFALTGFLVPLVKGMMMAQVANILIGAALWIASTTMAATISPAPATEITPALGERNASAVAVKDGEKAQNPARLALIFIALGVDMFGSAVPVFLFRFARSHTSPGARRIGRFFEFYPAINIEHKVERTNAFITLVLGYTVVGVIFQNAGAFGLNAFLGKAILGLVQAFVFNWLYFEVDGANIHTHAIRRRVESGEPPSNISLIHPIHPSPCTLRGILTNSPSAFLWQYAHLALMMSYILAGAALSRIVVVTDCPNAPLDALTVFYQERSAEAVSSGLRLYYCIGLGISLFSMGLISLSHEHKVPLDACRLPKWVRLTNRLGVCIIFFCLPAAGDRLNSLSLVAITTSLSVWTLLFELWAKSCKTESFFGDDKCEYTASCGRRRLDEATKSDGEIDIVELGRTEKTAVMDVS
jgi:low temperature requirement protein LtrA